MNNLHGVLLVVDKFSSLKRYSLIYDKIGYCIPSIQEPLFRDDLPKDVWKIVEPIIEAENKDIEKQIIGNALNYSMVDTLWWLEDRGFCYEVYKQKFTIPQNIDSNKIKDLEMILEILKKESNIFGSYSYHELLEKISYSAYDFFKSSLMYLGVEMRTKLSAIVLSILYEKEIYPLYPSHIVSLSSNYETKYIPFKPEYNLPSELSNKKSIDCVQMLINYFPIPDSKTSWERIFEFREDPDTKYRFTLFRNWINKLNKNETKMEHVIDEYETLVYEYSNYMKIHEIKINPGILETFIVSGSELVENVIKLNFGKIAKQLFMFKQRKIDLFESEIKTPGREISYILKAQKEFSQEKCKQLFGN